MEITTEICSSLSEINQGEWDQLVRGDFIFASYEFLKALEDAKCVGRRTGWMPMYVIARSAGKIAGALLMYLKTDSYGEYIFDWSWANAAQGSDINYYPKLTSAVPFTPATGPKFLLGEGAKCETVFSALVESARALQAKTLASSLHFLFTTPDEAEKLKAQGFTVRHSYQYHWRNREWKTFDDFLSSLRSKRRTEIKRERDAAAALPVRTELLTGDQLEPQHATWMHDFYRSTIEKMGGIAYLNESFFKQVFTTLKNNILLVMAFDENDQPIAGALNFFAGATLFGRYWGCLAEYKNLHFEMCYYRTVEWAISRGMTLFEAGAQGEQKFTRGFQPSLCYSAHWLENQDLARAVDHFIKREQVAIDRMFKDYEAHDPFKRDESRI